MRRPLLEALLAGALPLSGCAYVGLAPVLAEAVNSSRGGGYVGEDFEAAAAEACTSRAARYGRVTLGTVRRVSDTAVQVAGSVQEATRERAFACDFRSNGRIAGFSI